MSRSTGSRLSPWIAVSAHAQDIAAGDAALARFDLDAALTTYRAVHSQAPDN